MRRLLRLLCVALCAVGATPVLAPVSVAVVYPWFAKSVGNATQVISVVGTGGSNAKMDVYQRTAAGWEPVAVGIPTFVGSEGLAPQAKSGYPATPMGYFSLDYAFGTDPNPGGGLPYVQVGPDHWWSGDGTSPTFNSMQVCKQAQCPFNTAASENLEIPQYKHAVVMGVNKAKVPDGGAAFFFSHHRRSSDRRLRGDRRRHACADHPLAEARCGDRDCEVAQAHRHPRGGRIAVVLGKVVHFL